MKFYKLPFMTFLVMTCISLCSQNPFAWHMAQPDGLTSGAVALTRSALGGYVGVAYGGPDASRYINIIRFNENGDTLWSKKFHSHYNANGQFINRFCIKAAPASDGGLFILTANLIPEIAYNAVLRVNANGDSLWQTTISAVTQWAGAIMDNIVATPDNGCLVSGREQGFPSAPKLVKLNANGSIAWTNTNFAGDFGYNLFKGLSVNEQGKIFVTGQVHNNINGDTRLLVVGLNADGIKEWEHVYFSGNYTTGDSTKAFGVCAVPTSDGGCIIGGHVSDPGQSGGRALLMRFSQTGELLWTRRYYRWDYYYQQAIVYHLSMMNNGNFLAMIHQNSGYTTAWPTFMAFNTQGDSLWTQYGLPRQLNVQGIDPGGNILTYGAIPHANFGYWDHSFFMRTSPGGVFQIPQNQLPNHQSTNQLYEIEFKWTPTEHKKNYTLQLSTDSTFASNTQTHNNISDNVYNITGLQPATKYYWRVRVNDHLGGHTAWSNPTHFTTKLNLDVESKLEEVPVVFPNPAMTQVNIVLPKNWQQPTTLKLLSLTGKTIKTTTTAIGEPIVFDLPDQLPAGTYLLRIFTADKVYNHKLMVR